MVSIELMILAALLPIMTITAFVIGYNMNAAKKIRLPKKPPEKKPTEDEEMLERINNARV